MELLRIDWVNRNVASKVHVVPTHPPQTQSSYLDAELFAQACLLFPGVLLKPFWASDLKSTVTLEIRREINIKTYVCPISDSVQFISTLI